MDFETGQTDPVNSAAVEGLARVVALEGGLAWLEPEQTTSCGHCASKSVCGGDAFGNRMKARRFALPNDKGMRIGDRIVIGVSETMLVKASMTVYAIPLFTLFAGGIAAHLNGLGDGLTLLSCVVGLGVGLALARLMAMRLTAKGDLSPVFLRFAPPVAQSESCELN